MLVVLGLRLLPIQHCSEVSVAELSHSLDWPGHSLPLLCQPYTRDLGCSPSPKPSFVTRNRSLCLPALWPCGWWSDGGLAWVWEPGGLRGLNGLASTCSVSLPLSSEGLRWECMGRDEKEDTQGVQTRDLSMGFNSMGSRVGLGVQVLPDFLAP